MAALPQPSVPLGQRIYAIGDIHGRLDLLRALLDLIEKDRAQGPSSSDQLIFLGDYIDRGLDTKGVLDHLIAELPKNIEAVFLRGNHDDAMTRFLVGETELTQGWLLLGGTATLASYGLNPFLHKTTADSEKLRQAFAEKVPFSHVDFLQKTKTDWACGDYYFVHAGIRPGVPLDQQKTEDKLWVRNMFLTSTLDHGKIIVHGHTVEDAPVIRPNRIGIDTGAFATGRLTCLVLQGTERRFLRT